MSRPALLHALFASAIVSVLAPLASAATIDDLTSVVGTGANRAAVVIDFNDGKSTTSLGWVYRFDGPTVAAEQAFLDVVRADAKLFAKLGARQSWGLPIYGIGYDADATNGFGVSNVTAFDADGIVTDDVNRDGGTPTFAGDRYAEGWATGGFWGEYLAATDPFASGGTWSFGGGVSADTLVDGDYLGFSFAPGFADSTPSSPVPEPTAVVAVAAAALSFGRRRRA